jgi:DNA-binding transcriptional MerR regulator
MPTFSIGQLSKRAGVAVDTVRYYERSVAKVKRAAEAKLADVEQRLAELERIRNGLRSLVAACPGHGRAEACPILNALNEEDAP